MDEATRYRWCAACREEFRPDIERCSDCGGALQDRYEGVTTADKDDDDDPAPAPAADPRGFVRIYSAPNSRAAERAARRLGRAGIPFAVTAGGHGEFLISVPEDAVENARASLPHRRPAEETTDADEARCPACGHADVAGADECPECGLALTVEE